MTISCEKIIEKMLRNKGTYPGDPQMALIYKYESPSGAKNFACFETHTPNDIFSSPYVANPILLMEDGKLTKEGKKFLDSLTPPEMN